MVERHDGSVRRQQVDAAIAARPVRPAPFRAFEISLLGLYPEHLFQNVSGLAPAPIR
jgi:hypothetical protein